MTTYRGYIIEPVFSYFGKHPGKLYDFQYWNENDPEDNGLASFTTLERVKQQIDEKIEESTLTI